MPALNPVELKQRADMVAESVTQPTRLIKETRLYLEQYQEIKKRSAATAHIVLNVFNVKPPVIKELANSLYEAIVQQKANHEVIIETFWNEAVYEYKIIALKLIEKISTDDFEAAWQLITSLAIESLDDSVLDSMAKTYIIVSGYQQDGKLWNLLDRWIANESEERNKLALKVIELIVNYQIEFDVPHALGLIRRAWKKNTMVLIPYIKNTLLALLTVYPQDTLMFLRTTFEIGEYKSMKTIVRQLVGHVENENLVQEIKNTLRRI